MSDSSEIEAGSCYIRRDADGRIVSISQTPAQDHDRAGPDDADEVAAFARSLVSSDASLAQSDLALIRVIEDLIDVLIEKEVLRLTDLPESAQAKLVLRQRMRSSLRSLTLFGDDDETL